ncbi:MAG: hypothetical protein U0640_15270 [Phycisphaerales bacterium]
MKNVIGLSALGLAAIAGQAIGQVTVNGVRGAGEPYALVWAQNQPTSYGDNVPGSIGTSGNPEAVVFGLELAIPLAALGNPTGGTIKLAGIMGSSSNPASANLSNQVIGADPLPLSGTYNAVPFSGGFPNLGQGRTVNFANNAVFPGNQYLTITIPPVASRAAGMPTLDGQLDGLNGNNGAGGWWAGARTWIQTNYTSLANSELDNMYVRVSDNGTPGNGADDMLCLFVAGNFNSYHRVGLFFDYEAGGQNRLLSGNQNWGFGFIPGCSATSAVSTDGLTWDAGFEPDAIMIANGNTTDQSYYDWFLLPSAPSGAGQGTYLGNVNYGDVGGAILEGAAGVIPTGGTLLAAINNSNSEGVGNAPVGGSLIPSRDLCGGSELDNLYSYIDNNGTPGDASDDQIHLFLGANLENNFNSLVLFFDADATDGQNVIRGSGATPPNPFFDSGNGLNRMGSIVIDVPDPDPDIITPGLTFEPGFTADYILRVGNSASEVYANAVCIRANGRLEVSGFQTEFTSYNGGDKYPDNSPIDFPGTFADYQEFQNTADPLETNAAPRTTTNQNPTPIGPIDPQTLTPSVIVVDIDNNNIAGVTGTGVGASVAGAADVATGVEIRIRASELGWNGTTPLRVAGFIMSSDYTNISNQVIGGIQSVGFFENNLGESSQVDFSTVPGTQYVTLLAGGGPVCDSIDFNNDTSFFDPQDIDAFLSVYSEGPCIPETATCNDIDFNNDTSVFDPCDISSFLLQFSEGPCELCPV